ncbi:hypothetical protein ACQUJO_12460, partial [Ralstonia pseudosolanacearum]
LERHHLEFVLGGRRALEHPAIKDKGLAGGEAFVSNLNAPEGAFFYAAQGWTSGAPCKQSDAAVSSCGR